ncbi:MAG: penicillin-binding protein 2 [Alphaproteobacteria bacterium]|nr:penicillin-binding protein 2 [Alphaproteobacteria bacterium]
MINRDNDKGKILIKRTLVVALFNLFAMLIIILRLYYLQIYNADRYKMLADKNRISTRILIPHRGIIYDRNGIEIATNQQNFMAMIVGEQTTNVDKTLQAFNKIMPLNESEIERIKKDLKRNRSFVPIRIKDNLSWEEVSRIQLNSADLPGIFIDEGLNRYYPYAEKTAHLLGYVGYLTEAEIKRNKERTDNQKDEDPLLEVPEFKIGKEGIERLYEKKLRGNGGNLKLEVNAYGRIMQEIERFDGIPGENISLSIDVRLQEKAFELFGEEAGSAIVMNVESGEILAFTSFPTYDTNMIVKGISSKEWNELRNNEKKPLINKAIAGQYSPGSTFKMIVALAALENNVIRKDSSVFCSGRTFLGSHAFHCWKKEGHGHTNVVSALQHSCDIFFYEMGQRLGIDKISEMSKRFSLGSRLNLGFSGEAEGLIPNREWKLKRFKEPWQQGENLISAIGQGYILTTPIQLVTMLSQMTNGGYKLTPTFIKNTDSDSIKKEKINISEKNLEIIKEGMFDVINKPGGTAFMSQFNYNGKRMGGKTGTTQVRRITMKERQSGIIKQEDLPWKYRNHALFIGYAPHDTPKYAVVVIVEHGGSGSAKAAPIASKLLKETLRLEDLDKQPIENKE